MNRIAIIGAGITGLSTAYHLPKGSDITIFDKSRKPGGRVSSRTTRQFPGYSFDHGTPFFKPQGQFKQVLQQLNAIKQQKLTIVKSLTKQHLSKKSTGKFYVGNNKIESVPLAITKRLNHLHQIKQIYSTRIKQLIEISQKQYQLSDQNGNKYGPFNQVCFSIPYPQCLMVKQNSVNFSEQGQMNIIQANTYDCDWVVMMAVKPNSDINKQFIKYFSEFDICQQVSKNIKYAVSQKGRGYQGQDSLWVFTMNKVWSKENVELKSEEVQQLFLKELQDIINLKGIKPNFIKSHRWRYAHPKTQKANFRYEKYISFCGDWVQSRQNIQQCWELGQKIADHMKHRSKLGQL